MSNQRVTVHLKSGKRIKLRLKDFTVNGQNHVINNLDWKQSLYSGTLLHYLDISEIAAITTKFRRP